MAITKSQSRNLLFLTTLSMLTLFSCGRGCKPKESEQIITVDVALPIESLDPRYTTSAVASRIASLIYGSLFLMDDQTTPQPFLAEGLEAVGETTFKVRLRKNLKFHDGTPLTSADVVYTYTELKSPDVASPHAESFDYVKSIT